MRISPKRPIRSGIALAVAYTLLAASPLVGQRPLADAERELTGVVVDGSTRLPVAGAVVRIDGVFPAAVTDSAGLFRLSDVGPGPQLLEVRQFGYLDLRVEIVAPELPDVLIEIPLAPAPIALEGITAVVDRLAYANRRISSRRRAAAFPSRGYDQERLIRSGAPTVFDFLTRGTSLTPGSCNRGGVSMLCVRRRGRLLVPKVFVDEMPSPVGLDELATYAPHDLYLLEVYCSGTQIRAYTFDFMRRMTERPRALIPVFSC